MIITKNKIVILDNPKTGSRSLRTSIYPQIVRKGNCAFRSNKNVYQVDFDYDNANYGHGSLKSAVEYSRTTLKDDPEAYTYITAIRNPYDRIRSWCKDQHNRSKETLDISPKQVFELPIDCGPSRFLNFIPTKFRFYEDFKITEFMFTETLNSDLRRISEKYKLNLIVDDSVRENKSKLYPSLDLSMDSNTLSKINEFFHEDFIDGGYTKK